MDEVNNFSSTVELQVDTNSGHLGTRKEIGPDSSHANQRSFGRRGVRGNVVHLEHGTYAGGPASLISMKFYFLHDGAESSGRFNKAEIRVSFDKILDEDIAPEKASVPAVKHFSPSLIQGRPTQALVSERASVGLDASVAPAVASVAGLGASVGYSSTHTFDREYQVKIKGIPWCSSSHNKEVENTVIWKLTENAKQAEGIPLELNVALLVQHDGFPFEGTVEIKAWTKSNVRLFGWPWPKPNPLIFKPTVSLGLPAGLASYDELKDEHWERLAPFVGSFHSYQLTPGTKLMAGTSM